MKTFPLLLFCLILAAKTFSQTEKPDIIIKKDNTKIEAVIQKVDKLIIEYKRFSNLTGPTFTVEKSEIASVMYSNGEVESFTSTPQMQSVEGNVVVAKEGALRNEETTIVTRETAIPRKKLFTEEIQSYGTAELRGNLNFWKKQHRKTKTSSIVFWSAIGGGAIGVLAGAIASDGFQNEGSPGVNAVGGTLAVLGALSIFPAIIGSNAAKREKRNLNAVKQELIRRGEHVIFRVQPTINYRADNGMIGLRLVSTF